MNSHFTNLRCYDRQVLQSLFLSFHRAFCNLFNYTHQHMHIYIYIYIYIQNEGITMCLKINQYYTNVRQHNLFILE